MTMNLKQFTSTTAQLARMVQDHDVPEANVFQFAIAKQNEMYTLPMNEAPTLDEELLNESPIKRIRGFVATLRKEVDEGEEIIAMLEHRERVIAYSETGTIEGAADTEAKFLEEQIDFGWIDGEEVEPNLEVTEFIDRKILVAIADWLGDVTVYCRSEAMKFGLPLEAVLFLIMGSNFTKLNADGSVIKDENGKVQKGPFFQKPEPAIEALLFNRTALVEEALEQEKQVELTAAIAMPALLAEAIPDEITGLVDDDEDYEEEEDEDEDLDS